MTKHYFIDRSESGDWYLIPLDFKTEWERWRDGLVPEEESYNEPPFVQYINNYDDVIFENPVTR